MGTKSQMFLSKDMEPKQIDELVKAASDYEDIRNERMELTEREVAAQLTLIEVMKKYGLTEYNYLTTQGTKRRCYILPGEPKAKVQQVKDKTGKEAPPKVQPDPVEQPHPNPGLPGQESSPSEPMSQAAAESLQKDIENTATEASGVDTPAFVEDDGLTHAFAPRSDMPGVCRFCGFDPQNELHSKPASTLPEKVETPRPGSKVVDMPKGRKKK